LTLLEIKALSVGYRTISGEIGALDHVTLSIEQGETVAVVGESGSGKSTLGLSIVRLLPTNASYREGDILIEGRSVREISGLEIRSIRGKMVFMIFQDPLNSLNPVKKVGSQILEALLLKYRREGRALDDAADEQIINQVRDVRLPDPEVILERYPHQLSGGQIQRVVIAMSLLLKPRLLIADEPTSALDVTIQAQILKLLEDLKKEYGMSVIFITHDVSVAYNIADRIAVMYAGKIVEVGPAENIIRTPLHPYTQALISSVPSTTRKDGRLKAIQGVPPNLLDPPHGCRYHPRCPHATDICRTEEPGLTVTNGSSVFCWLHAKER
jgi:peptide/nickel transport system ATP-binding protein